jgi:hypothetical protein
MTLTPEQRKRLITMARERAKPGTGSDARRLRETGGCYGVPSIAKYMEKVPFVVAGGIATRLYMPERMTLDLDILVASEEFPEAEAALEASGCRRHGGLAIGGSTWVLPDGNHLDVIPLPDPWVADALAHPRRGPEGLPYIDLPYLVLMKLASGRLQDLADVSRMLGRADEKLLERVRGAVRRYREQDEEDLDGLIALGKLEYGPPEED